MLLEKFDDLKDVLLIKPRVFKDNRGYFLESYNQQKFEELTGIGTTFIQDNESESCYGTLRGLHFQKPPFAQAKLVRVVKGRVLDVALDLRPSSPTFGHHKSFILDDENKHQLYIPRGFAHAFLVLSESAIFSYKVDNSYAPDHDSGIIFSDETLKIDWPIATDDILVSEKDNTLQSFLEYKNNPDFK